MQLFVLYIIAINYILCCLGEPPKTNLDNISYEVPEQLMQTKRILGGVLASPKQLTYIVSLQNEKFEAPGEYTKFCGGSIIARSWILTAAHCCRHIEQTYGYNTTWARAGILESFATTTGFQLRRIKQHFVHENFYVPKKWNDICLIKVEKPFELNNYVSKIDIGPNCKSNDKRGLIMGFGKTVEPTIQLNFAEVDIADFNLCVQHFPNVIKMIHICAGVVGKGACQGDSGGPFVQFDAYGKPCLKGVSSYGKRNCEKGNFSVYTRPEPYADWITQLITKHP